MRFLPQLLMPIRQSLKLYSQRLNVFASFTVAYIVATNGSDIPALLEKIPAPYNLALAPLAGYITFMAVSYARLVPQTAKDEGQATNELDANHRESV